MMERIFFEIAAERRRQDARWGGAGHDDKHSLADWIRFIGHQYEIYFDLHQSIRGPERTLLRLVKIAALAVAGIQSIDRRHPEAKP
jgi:hypothetical protein